MIENICEQIKQVLGNRFVIFYAEKSLDLSEAEKKSYKDKVLGVFVVSSGTFRPLQGIQGLEGGGVLQLLLPIDSKDNFNALEYAMTQLVANTNGKITNDGTIYNYVLQWDYPLPVGDVNNQYGSMRQAYSMSFNFVLSSQAVFANDFLMTVDGETLTGITAWNEESTINALTKLDINAFAVTNVAQFNGFSLTIEALLQSTDIWQRLQTESINRTNEIYEISYVSNEITNTFGAILANWQRVGVLGQFQVVRLSFLPAFLNNITVIFNGNGGVWQTVDTHYLNYDANGGSGVMASQTATEGEFLTVANNSFIRSNYDFVEWNTAADGSGLVYDGGDSLLMGSSDITLYAQWQEIDYLTVTYNANGGTTTITDINQYQSGDLVSVKFTPTPELTDCTFAGWAYSSSATTPDFKTDGTTSFIISANTTLYAVWQITVIFNGNGGTWEN